MFVLCLLIVCVFHASAYERNEIRGVKGYVLDARLHKAPDERRIFEFRRHGIKIDVKVVPSAGDESTKNNDYFPEFPVKDIGKCIIEFSLGCVRKRFVRFLETVGRLDEITLHGQDVKLVRSGAASSDGRSTTDDSDVSIERSVDDLFDSFALRVTLPRWNGKRERNQIDVMLDETAVAEGRKKGGGGGKGGSKCKMMMMGMLMMIKMKLIGVAALKGMMMGGMSLMAAAMMLMHKFGKGGGAWQSGGGSWQNGGGGHLKEIVLLTKSSGGGGGCCSGPSDSYSAPPSGSHGAPSGGGGGYGGGGWGRSFHKRPMMLSHEEVIKAESVDGSNRGPTIGEAIPSNAENLDYPDYQDYREPMLLVATSSPATTNWNATNYIISHEYGGNEDPVKNKSGIESAVTIKGRGFNGNQSTTVADIIEKNVDLLISTDQPDVHVANTVVARYTDEWQATAEKISSGNVPSSDSGARVESRQIESRTKHIPLLRGI